MWLRVVRHPSAPKMAWAMRAMYDSPGLSAGGLPDVLYFDVEKFDVPDVDVPQFEVLDFGAVGFFGRTFDAFFSSSFNALNEREKNVILMCYCTHSKQQK